MLYELRVYHCLPGKLPLVMARFEMWTINIWKRHGIDYVGFWTNLVGPSSSDLSYMLRW
ncbi:NIPSNAP family protein [Bradyrhizobium sp. BWA-3-5]|uniref:NIPSNAP family protein n=1 Tax=Bradyrhizobium sp. BWA-3-5 TaxID=3080013 RepID=UPI00293F66BF|nr:NIPSNAP family protein [Bradyrhizobium sp. BWA-3-5]WOH63761.1 NIPSNAP family protein [Bradyrhizobium sp. BWA-3-5]